MRDKDIVKLENSLREFILDDYEEDRIRGYFPKSRTSELYRYQAFIIDIQPSRNVEPYFTVSIGILSATFNIAGGEKTSGSLGGLDERLIQRWLTRGSNKAMLLNVWEKKAPERHIKLIPFDYS